ncbi:TetR/AcrR family transcriptional regulator [Phenylobacterium sp.]|uniref:TetR/AcrR family transcriptional regulator n=1 Tax=Phenylobacterium sp. TaxID=1871053 RepID=UPI0025E65A27|nr:TetR/AcrR family transcriptional regulator [Phenylobacterium sp.]
MSSGLIETTRDRILDAALGLIERDQGGAVSMGAIAKAAGLSRQALYLTFADKADLYIALVRRVDESRGVPMERAKVEEAADGETALHALIDMQARLNPTLGPIANAMDMLRRQDPDAERAWQDRLEARMQLCRIVAGLLEREGRLRKGLDQATAAEMIWTVTSLRTWDDLVTHSGWSADAYRAHLTDLLGGWLASRDSQAD